MSDTTQFWKELDEHIQRKIDAALRVPTGVTPGVWNGLTVDRYGRVTLAQVGGNSALLAFANATGGGVSIASGAAGRVIFDASYDPQSIITTGASWVMTIPTTARYRVRASVGVTGGAGTYSAGAFYDLWVVKSTSTLMDTVDYQEVSPATYSPYKLLNGVSKPLLLTAGDTIHIKVENQSGVTATAADTDDGWVALEYA